MGWFHPKSLLDDIFEGGIIVKGISGLMEFACGMLLFAFSPEKLHRFISFVTQRELLEDPHDRVANLLLHVTAHVTAGSRAFLISYLWIHAGIKLIAVVGILKNQLWAYPFSLVTLGMLMAYQIYSIVFVGASAGLVLLTLFDVAILWLIWREYGKAHRMLE